MQSPEALLDSNVLVAAIVEDHERHVPSLALVTAAWSDRLSVAAHSYAEAFHTLTRRGARAQFEWSPQHAWAALSSISAATRLVGLTPSQTLDGVRIYAAGGGVGARLYDHLIGQAAVLAGARVIVTWNTGHLRSLFPGMTVETPEEHLTRRGGEAAN